MNILLLVGFFESFLFPRSVLYEREFNPAHLHEKKFELILGSETRYELAELRAFYFYSRVDRFSIRFTSFGGSLYRENFFELGFGFPVGGKFALGFDFAGLNSWVKDLSNEFTYSVKAGGLYGAERFTMSVWVNNINMPRISSIDYAPISYTVRFEYLVRGNLNFNIAACGVETEMPFYKCGCAFAPYDIIVINLGVNTKPIVIEYGLKMNIGNMVVFYSGNRHQQLGLTHNLGLGFRR